MRSFDREAERPRGVEDLMDHEFDGFELDPEPVQWLRVEEVCGLIAALAVFVACLLVGAAARGAVP